MIGQSTGVADAVEDHCTTPGYPSPCVQKTDGLLQSLTFRISLPVDFNSEGEYLAAAFPGCFQ